MIRFINSLKLSTFFLMFSLFLSGTAYSANSSAEGINLLEQALDNVTAKGDSNINIGGDLVDTCTIGASNAICVGTYVWTDDHSNDSSVNKGAVLLSGSAQSGIVTNINVTTSVSPTATGVNTVGSIDIPQPGSVVDLSNSNNATGFIGGY